MQIGFEYELIEKHYPRHESENYLAVTDNDLSLDRKTYQVIVEIINNYVSKLVDGRIVAIAPIDNEILRSGRVRLVNFWDSHVACIFSNIRIKTLDGLDESIDLPVDRKLNTMFYRLDSHYPGESEVVTSALK